MIKTVLNRITSIVRVPSLLPNKDNTINRDDDAKRSSLNVTHVIDVVNKSMAVDDRFDSSIGGESKELIAF